MGEPAAPSYFTARSLTVGVVGMALTADRNWLTFTASVSAEPAATLVMRRSLPAEPTETSPIGVRPAKVKSGFGL
ncbi:hypothetical protein D3C87_2070340 [compost metagenome]